MKSIMKSGMKLVKIKLPKIIIHKELPQWITSSDKACYHPFSNSIHIKRAPVIIMFKYLLHEIGHWFFYMVKFNKGHRWLDEK